MKKVHKNITLCLLIFNLAILTNIFAQNEDKTKIEITQNPIADTTLKVKKNKSGLDSIVYFSANDTIVFDINSKVLRLRGNSKLRYKTQFLESEIIELYFNESTLSAEPAIGENNKPIGFPKFSDKSESFIGEKIKYNFKTNQGVITLAETEIGDGYYQGAKIKRVSETELFVKDGAYTTCDAPHPHFYFGSPEMKVVMQDRIFIDPIIFYVQDLPIFVLPIGLFFPSKTGRQSGIIIPSFFLSTSRGVQLNDIGLYLALSDYYDTKFTVDFFSKGGYTLKNYTQWVKRDEFSGNLNLQYGKTRFNPDDEYSQNWRVDLRHNHTLTPTENISANLSFSTPDFNRNTSWNLANRVVQDIRSDAYYNNQFDNGSSLSLSYSRSQNIINNTYSETPSVSFSIPQWNFLKPYVSSTNWMKDFSFTYSGSAIYNTVKSIETKPVFVNDSIVRYDSTFKYTYSSRISHSPRISLSLPKLSHFSITPSFSFSFNNYFRRLDRQFNPADSSITDNLERGFFTEYTYNLGLNVSTRLFGIIQPNILGIRALRHTLQPTIGWSYSPDLSSEKYGFYGYYNDLRTNNRVRYSRYEPDGGGLASNRLSNSLTYSLSNSFGAKIIQGDTLDDLTLEFLTLNLNGYYNFAADSIKASDINVSFYTPTFANISFNGSAAFTLYDEERDFDPKNNRFLDSYHRVNKFLFQTKNTPARLTSFSVNLSTSFVSSGSGSFSSSSELRKDTIGLGERFQQRMTGEEEFFDFFGDKSPGYSSFNFPWTLSLSLRYLYSSSLKHIKNETIDLTANFSFRLTETWMITGGAQFNFVSKELIVPNFNITKDLHCWQFNFTWYPIGINNGFYLMFGIKAPQLQDLKIEKRSSPFF
ncbi:MAG: putative LPS assembly protein LptD [Candidatus Kapabacteria bacterium]|nr:putative LPS assembly protein LptD [Candidatus Kapabacteria bacterium]